MKADRLREMRAFLGFGHVAVLDPLQPVAGDLPARLLHRRHLGGRTGERRGDAVDRQRDDEVRLGQVGHPERREEGE